MPHLNLDMIGMYSIMHKKSAAESRYEKHSNRMAQGYGECERKREEERTREKDTRTKRAKNTATHGISGRVSARE